MSSFISRLLVSAIGLPLVLGLLWLDGWWLFGLAVAAAVVAVHEFVTMARPLRPLAPAIYIGVVLALVGAHRSGAAWMLGGRLFGRHKLAPSLSPGKTWEGFVAGSLAGIFVSFIALYDTRHTYLSSW